MELTEEEKDKIKQFMFKQTREYRKLGYKKRDISINIARRITPAPSTYTITVTGRSVVLDTLIILSCYASLPFSEWNDFQIILKDYILQLPYHLAEFVEEGV